MGVQLLVHRGIKLSVEKFPEKVAVIYKDKRVTYRELDSRANRIANGIADMGLKKGDKVGILLSNCNEFVEIYYGMAKQGLISVPVNFRLAAPEIQYIVKNADSKALIMGEEFVDKVDSIRPHCEMIGEKNYVVLGDRMPDYAIRYEDLLAGASDSEPDVEIGETDPYFIGYTSGTTGFPKGTVMPHRSIYNIVISHLIGRGISPSDTYLLIMPLFHSNSVWHSNLLLFIGGTIYVYPSGGFNPKEILEIIQKEKITCTNMVPTMSNLILNVPDKDKYDVSSMRWLVSSSAPLLTKTKEELFRFFKHSRLYEGYGSTETGAVTSLSPEDQLLKIRSIGRPYFAQEVRLLDETGKDVPIGEVGELYSRGPTLMKEYYKDPEKTKNAMRGEWVSVGDMARMDEEGYLYLVDRKQDMIISGGENISPTEVEEVLSLHPKVHEFAVIGVPYEKWGEAVRAVVVLKAGEEGTEEEIIKFCEGILAGYKKPKSVDFIRASEMPKTPTGKILRRPLREAYWKGRKTQI
ncbi:MAG: long-chain-fatty-acid--CoA ligase [Pseudomonadota bacterium]